MENFLSDHQTVGTLLKQERIRQDKSLDDVASATHIRRMFLEFIEEEHFDKLPSSLHVTGFLGVYAQYLGLSEQLVIGSYRRQMLLLRDIPAEEIFSIPQASLGKQIRPRPWLYLLFVGILIFLVFFFGYAYFYSRKNSDKKDLRESLSPDHPLSIRTSVGGEFSFFVKGKEMSYRLLEATNRAVTLMDVEHQIALPTFLYTEGLEYDLESNQEYDYMIYVERREKDFLFFGVKAIRAVRNPGQDSYAIVQISSTGEPLAQTAKVYKGTLTIGNTTDHDILFIAENLQGELTYNSVLPNQTATVSYFDKNAQPQYRNIFLQDVGGLSVDLDDQPVSSSRKNGSVGVLSCSSTRKKENESGFECKIFEGL